MDPNHSPNTEKVKYMLSDLNDHHNMKEEFVNGEDGYVQMKVWFGGLRNTLTVHANYAGDILLGKLDCVADSGVERGDVKQVLPDTVELVNFFDNGDTTKITVNIHSSRDSEPMDPKEFASIAEELKSALLAQSYISST